MQRIFRNIFIMFGICILITISSASAALAAPEDYTDEIQNGVNSALDEAQTYLDDIWNDVSGAVDDTVSNVQDYITSTEPEEITEPESNTNSDEEYYQPEDTEATEATEAPTEEVTALQTPTENQDYYDYSYEPPTEPPTESYQPEILTETYTDAPFIERFAITDAKEGNLFIALGLWIAITIGVVIVISVVHTTHKRKKGI